MSGEQKPNNARRRMVARLQKKHGRAVYEYTLSRVREPAIAKDITQQLFERCLTNKAVHIRTPLAFLYTMAFNAIVDKSRRDKRWSTSSISSGDESPTVEPELQLDRRAEVDNAIDLHNALNALAKSHAKTHAVVEQLMEGASGDEIEDELQIDHNAVEYRKRVAIARLRELLETKPKDKANEEGQS
jgi:RNA polymerase sigma factor (sigma-70 family)